MSCFFPSIFKNNTYKKVRLFLVSALVLIVAFLFSGCTALKKVGKFITGTTEEAAKTTGEIIGKVPDGIPISIEHKINFEALMVWGIILIVVALLVRYLINKYVHKNIKK